MGQGPKGAFKELIKQAVLCLLFYVRLLVFRYREKNEDEGCFATTAIPRLVRTSLSALSLSAHQQILTIPRFVRMPFSLSAHFDQQNWYNLTIFGWNDRETHANMVEMVQIDWMSAFSVWQRHLKHLKTIGMIFGISFLLSVSAHSGRKFVFLYYCYLLSFCALFKIFERFTTCMLSRLVRFRLVRTFFWTLHAH